MFSIGILSITITSVLASQIDSDSIYQLSPPMPPTAYLGQYYICQFQIIGLKFTSFKFEGLPRQFIQYEQGIIKGIPQKVGSYFITIRYSSNIYNSSIQTILRITLSSNSLANRQIIQQLTPKLTIMSNIDSYIFQQGKKITIKFSVIHGKNPYLWNYRQLPSQFFISNTSSNGILYGIFNDIGYYTFGVTCLDGNGATVDAYFTINIQPNLTISQGKLNLIDVPIAKPNNIADYQLALNKEKQSSQNLAKAGLKVSSLRNILDQAKKMKNMTTNNLILVNLTTQQLQNKFNMMETIKNKFQQKLNDISFELNRNKCIVSQYKKRLILLDNNINEIQLQINQKIDINNKFIIRYENLRKQYIKLQNQIIMNIKLVQQIQMIKIQSQITYNYSQITYNDALQAYSNAIVQLNNTNIKIINANNTLQDIKNQKILHTQILNNQTQILNNKFVELISANKQLSLVKSELKQAVENLGKAKYNQQIQLNKLYIAQSLKAQADASINIIIAQVGIKSSIKSRFAGCQQGAYPSIFGTTYIQNQAQNRFITESGQILLYGNCTQIKSNNIGNLIEFEGYIKDDSVHLMRYTII